MVYVVYFVISLAHSFIHSANKYLLSIYYVLSSDLVARDTAVSKTEKDPSPTQFVDSWQ